MPSVRPLPSLAAPLLVLACAPAEPAPPPPTQSFTEVTAAAGIGFRHTFGDGRFDSVLEAVGAGVALLDFDGDGWLDVYLVNGTWLDDISDPRHRRHGAAVDRLYRNRGDGTFEDVTARCGLHAGGYGMGAAVGDFDADGDEDLLVLNYGPNVLYRNEGDGTFSDVTEELGLAGPENLHGFRKWSVHGFFFDYDVDGDLDLFVADYLAFDPSLAHGHLPDGRPFPGPEAYSGQTSLLYRNDDGRFTEVTAAAGLLREDGKALGAAPGDLDGDGFPDLLVAQDGMRDLLFHNLGDGTFAEVALVAGIVPGPRTTARTSRQPLVADYDGDGRLDLFVTDSTLGRLFRNQGNLLFEEAPDAVDLAPLPRAGGWGGHFADFDNDGDVDLLVVRGGAFDLADAATDVLLANDGTGRLTKRFAATGDYFQSRHVSRGVACGDFDNDGDIDFVVNHQDVGGAPSLVRNDLSAGRHWLQLKLVGRGGNRDAIGARVLLTAGGRLQVREVGRAGSFGSQHDVRVHFGLGTQAHVERLVVVWPGGASETVPIPGVDRILRIEQSPP